MIQAGQLREFGFTNVGLSLVWLVTVTFGISILWNYETRPGPNPDQLNQWPADSMLMRSTVKPLVVMFTHPHCPCTRASVTEFDQIVSICHELAEFQVVMFDSDDSDIEWKKSHIIETVSAIPEVTVSWDKNGREARRFNVETSGHVLLYGSDGELKFSGGITASRGHEGSNAGRSRLVSWLRMTLEEKACKTDLLESPVFGCAFVDGTETSENE